MYPRRLLPLCLIFSGALFVLTAGAYMFDVVPFSMGSQGEALPSALAPARDPIYTGSDPLVFQQPEVDLGVAKAAIKHTFTYRNQSEHELTIERVTTSCSCSLSKPDRKILGPGESGSISLETDITRKEPGRHRFTVKIEYDCGGSKVAIASVLASYQPDLRIIPSYLDVTVTAGERASASIAIVDYRSSSLKILGIRSSSPNLTGQVIERPLEYLPGWRHVIDVRYTDPHDESRNSLTESLFLDTSDPENSLLSIQVSVRRLERLRVAPAVVKLAKGRDAAVLLRDSQGEKIVVDSAEVAGLAIVTFTPEAEQVKRISISLPETGLEPRKYPATIWIKVRKPCSRRLPITVRFDPSER